MTARTGWWIVGSFFALSMAAVLAVSLWALSGVFADWRDGGVAGVMAGANPTPRTFIPANNPTRLMMLDAPADGDIGDITAAAAEMNAPDAPALPTSFSPSMASAIAAPRVSHDGNLTRVSMGHGSPVRSPYATASRVYAPGGFSTNAVHAINLPSGSVAWSAGLGDPGPSSIAATDDYVVVNTESCTLFVLDADTGKLAWSRYLGDPQMAMPAVADGKVYSSYPAHGGWCVNYAFGQTGEAGMITGSHALACFDLASGKLLWQKWIDGDVLTQPTPAGDRVLAATFSGTLYQFDAATGEILSARAARATSAPTVHEGKIIYTRRVDQPDDKVAREVIAIDDLRTGKPLERFYETEAPYVDHRVQEHTRYAHSGRALDYGNGLGEEVFAANNVDRAWTNIGQGTVSNLQAHQGSYVVVADDGQMYTTRGNMISRVDPVSKRAVWSHQVEGNIRRDGGAVATAPALAGDRVIVGTLRGDVLSLDAVTGDVVERYDAGGPIRSQPAVMNGQICVGTERGDLVIINTNDPTLTGWPGFGG